MAAVTSARGPLCAYSPRHCEKPANTLICGPASRPVGDEHRPTAPRRPRAVWILSFSGWRPSPGLTPSGGEHERN
jgi:hypothetical protein